MGLIVRVALLGPIEVTANGVARPLHGLRRKALLAVLALHHGELVTTDRLIDVIWGQPTPINTLQSHISYLRSVLGNRTAIQSRPPGYVLELGLQAIDVAVAENLIRQSAAATDPQHQARQLRQALALWRGNSLADVSAVDWLAEQAQRLDQLRVQAHRILIESRLALGEHAAVLSELELLARDNPLDEQIHGHLIVALYRCHRQADALAAYRQLKHTLATELGIDPTKALRELESAVLRQDSILLTTISPPTKAPITAGGIGGVRLGSGELIGREAELAELHNAIRAAAGGAGSTAFLLGEPGIGKTRLATETATIAERLGLRVLRGRAAPASVQFRPLSEALLSALGHSPVPDDAALRPFLPALSRLVPHWPDMRPANGDDSPIVLAEAILRFIVALTQPTGCLLLLEDLHDADPDTLQVLDYLIDNAHREPVLILGTARDQPSPALQLLRAAQHRRAAPLIELTRLDSKQVHQLAADCLAVSPGQVPTAALDRLTATADGIPLHAEELIAGMVADGLLHRTGDRWTAVEGAASPVPASLSSTLVARADRLGPQPAALLQVAALLGRRFPAVTAGTAAGLTTPELLRSLRTAVEAQLLIGDPDPDWYAFRHALTAEALRGRLLPIERAMLARSAAEAVESSSFDGWAQLTGELWDLAGESRRSAERFGLAGQRAVACGAVSTGITLLERAVALVDRDPVDELVVEFGAALISAYATAGRVAHAYRLSERLNRGGGQIEVQLQLARVAAATGEWHRGLAAVREARRLGPGQGSVLARLDVVEAELIFGDPSVQQHSAARALARRALDAATENGLPDIACNALEILGRIGQLTDLAGAEALYRRGVAIADANDLVTRKLDLLYQLGAHLGVRAGSTNGLAEALAVAEQAGAVVVALDIELELAVVQLCRGEFAAAAQALERCEQTAERLRLTRSRVLAVGQQIMVAAHRGRPAEALLRRYRELGGEDDDFASAVHGFGLGFGHLLQEDPDSAWVELAGAVEQESRRPVSYLSFVHGPHLLLAVLTGRAGAQECAALAQSAQAQAGWNAQFGVLAEAVLHGQAGRRGEAESAATRFLTISEPYRPARHLGLRLVAEAAIADCWGEPSAWLRAAAAYFESFAPRVTQKCRALLTNAAVSANP